MKKAWKWILGILVVVLIVGALVAVPFVMRRMMPANFRASNPPAQPGGNLPNTPQQLQPRGNRGFGGWPGGPMMNNRRGFGNFGRGRMSFGIFGMGLMMVGMFFRLAIPLALFGLLLFGVYQLGRNAGARSTLKPAAVAPQVPPADADSGGQPVG